MTLWNQKAAHFILLAALLLLFPLTGCGTTPAEVSPQEPAPVATSTPEPAATPSPTAQPLVEENEKAAVDYSHTAEGYILARRGESEKRLKLRLARDTEYTYDLTGEEWTAFPISEGDGSYALSVFEQVEGTAYVPVLTLTLEVKLDDPFSPFLRPNQQVDYADAPLTLAKAAELTAECESPGEKVEKIYSFVSETLTYDEERAETVQSGYIPALDEVLQREKGICLDFAALMTAMLRSQGVPCKLAVGDAGKVYHAWTEVWDESGGAWIRYDPTFAASGKDVSGVEYAPKFYY